MAVLGLRYCLGFSLELWQPGATLRLQCSGFSLLWLPPLQSRGFSSCGTWLSSCGSWALEHRPNGCGPQHVGFSQIRG